MNPLDTLLNEGDRVLVVGDRARAAVERPGVHVSVDVPLAEVGVRMSRGEVDRVFIAASGVRPNGDVTAEVGTYALSVLSKFHGLPFIVLEGGVGEEVVSESCVTAWVRGHAIFTRADFRSGNIPPA